MRGSWESTMFRQWVGSTGNNLDLQLASEGVGDCLNRAETLICGIWCWLWVDSVKTEFKSRIPRGCNRELLGLGKPTHTWWLDVSVVKCSVWVTKKKYVGGREIFLHRLQFINVEGTQTFTPKQALYLVQVTQLLEAPWPRLKFS